MKQITLNDLLAQETKRDPIAFTARLREQGPILPFYGLGPERGWLVTRYEDVLAILKDPRFIKDPQKLAPSPEGEQAEADTRAEVMNALLSYRRDMLVTDPPDHTRLRSLVSKAFTPRMIEHLRPRIQHLTVVQNRGNVLNFPYLTALLE